MESEMGAEGGKLLVIENFSRDALRWLQAWVDR
jgi:hypothetical protein